MLNAGYNESLRRSVDADALAAMGQAELRLEAVIEDSKALQLQRHHQRRVGFKVLIQQIAHHIQLPAAGEEIDPGILLRQQLPDGGQNLGGIVPQEVLLGGSRRGGVGMQVFGQKGDEYRPVAAVAGKLLGQILRAGGGFPVPLSHRRPARAIAYGGRRSRPPAGGGRGGAPACTWAAAAIIVSIGRLTCRRNSHTITASSGTTARLADNQRVCSMIETLSTMLDAAISRDGRSTVTLAEELKYVDAYLYITQERLGDRLTVTRPPPQWPSAA